MGFLEAWPSVRSDFGLPLDFLGGLFVSMAVGYLASRSFGGRLAARLHFGTVLALSRNPPAPGRKITS